jgi:3-keto-5-aminohexanoate cleavage enzyme
MDIRYIYDEVEPKKLIITVAPAGGMHGQEVNPNVPMSAKEFGDASYEAYNAGASIIHIHPRDKEGKTTESLEAHMEYVEAVRSRCNVITQVGNGIGIKDFDKEHPGKSSYYTLEERMNLVNLSPPPEMLTINGGTFQPHGIIIMENSPEFNEEFVRRALENGVKGIETEIYDLSHIHNTLDLREKKVLPDPIHWDFVFGMGQGMPPRPEYLFYCLRAVPEPCSWQAACVGKHQTNIMTLAILLGGNVRVGFEDHVFYSKGELAKSNAQVVERIVRIAKDLGREIATPDEAREIMHLN